MSLGPYRYVNGKRYTFGEDGQWWHVNYSSGGDDYGKPVPASEVTPYAVHHHAGHHSRHHGAHHASHASHATLAQAHASPIRKPNGTGAPTPSADPWEGNNYARELFQRQGARYFLGADHFVTRMTQLYTAAYTAAFFAPEIIATIRFGWQASRVGMLGSNVGRIFWSGGEYLASATTNTMIRLMSSGIVVAGIRAEAIAEASEGRLETLEMTPFGQWIQAVAPTSNYLWNLASRLYATGAAGQVTVVQGDYIMLRSVWATLENKQLMDRLLIEFVSATNKW